MLNLSSSLTIPPVILSILRGTPTGAEAKVSSVLVANVPISLAVLSRHLLLVCPVAGAKKSYGKGSLGLFSGPLNPTALHPLSVAKVLGIHQGNQNPFLFC